MTAFKPIRYRPRAKWLDTFWVSCRKWTVMVRCEADGRITDAAPLVRKFIGQPMSHLEDFAARCGGPVQVVKLNQPL